MMQVMGLTTSPSEDCLYLNVWTPGEGDRAKSCR